MSRRKQADLVSVNFNDITFSIGKDKFSQLSKEHINTIIRYDAQCKINGAGIIHRKNQLSFLIQFVIKTHKPFSKITKDDILLFLVQFNGGTLELYKAYLKKFFMWYEKPELIKDLRRGVVAETLTKEDLWTEDDVLKLLKVVDPQMKERDIILSPIGKKVISYFIEIETPLPVMQSWKENLRRWATIAGLDPLNINIKSTRKTWCSWLLAVYGTNRLTEICLSMGHDSVTSIKRYLNVGFRDEDKSQMAEYVEGWI